MRTLPWLLALALVGCSGGNDGEPADTAPVGDDDDDTTTDFYPDIPDGGACDIDTSSAPTVEEAREVLVLDSDDGYGVDFGPGVGDFFTTEEDYAAWLASVGSSAAPGDVDFDNEVAVVVWYQQSSTCGLGLAGWDAWDVDGTPHLVVRFDDLSYQCQTVCDAEGRAAVVIAVPDPPLGFVTTCRLVGGGCE